MGTSNPKILNLDELELQDSDITIIHQGEKHVMRILTVDMFIAQNKRALEHQRLAAEQFEAGEDPEVGDVLEVIKASITEFFPTLPVGDMPTQKMFTIFAWLNELSSKLNEIGADKTDAGDAEGNAPSTEEPAES